jgi:mannan endo-1,4-beta-mannosidase
MPRAQAVCNDAMARPRPAAVVTTNLSALLLLLLLLVQPADGTSGPSFVGVGGTQFVVANGGGTVYFSGFNAYWLMTTASDPARRGKVAAAFRQASAHGLNLARTWAFSDGGDTPLQAAPGVYDEAVFRGLDFVVAEARRHGVYLLLCLTNNFPDFGGKRQYVQWARGAADDDFFNTTVVKGYYKDHVKVGTYDRLQHSFLHCFLLRSMSRNLSLVYIYGMQTVLTRVNTLTGVAYRDDPIILGWELMNEPRCDADPTGAMVQVK